MAPFHERYGVPVRYPQPLAITPAILERLAPLPPHRQSEALTDEVRRDFHERFPVLGEYGGIRGCGGSDRAWAAHGQSYMMHAFGEYLAALRAADDRKEAA